MAALRPRRRPPWARPRHPVPLGAFGHLASEADRLQVVIVTDTRVPKLCRLYLDDMPGLKLVSDTRRDFIALSLNRPAGHVFDVRPAPVGRRDFRRRVSSPGCPDRTPVRLAGQQPINPGDSDAEV